MSDWNGILFDEMTPAQWQTRAIEMFLERAGRSDLQSVTNSFRTIDNVERINLDGVNLRVVPDCINLLTGLKELVLRCCKLNDDYLKNERVMSKDERKNKINEINKVEKEFRQKQQTLQQELQSKQNSELNRIRVIVENAINEYAKDNDYDLILRADGTTLYAKTYVDITQEIIEKLN